MLNSTVYTCSPETIGNVDASKSFGFSEIGASRQVRIQRRIGFIELAARIASTKAIAYVFRIEIYVLFVSLKKSDRLFEKVGLWVGECRL
ncbi:MAG: hypothetical protein HY785_10490 [Oscillatoriophycideae cyanobacterium NC_groundwater_1537_Pr4_S-0.65um_50_18]|nr:hypothetical protein [Oscillatoriophycideae cyanobacterium NC_groundwater_1537_Pr4_S-0.65um_50_18]